MSYMKRDQAMDELCMLKVSAVKAYRQAKAEIEARENPHGTAAALDPLQILREIAAQSRLGAVIADELARAEGIEFEANVPPMPRDVGTWLLQAGVARLDGRSLNGSPMCLRRGPTRQALS